MSGFNTVYFQNVSEQWTCERWRLWTPRRNSPRALKSSKATKKKDRTEFDSEVYCSSEDDSWSPR